MLDEQAPEPAVEATSQYLAPVGPDKPEELTAVFADAINSRDLPRALAQWCEEPTIIQPDGHAVRGREAVAGVLQGLIDNEITLAARVAHVFVAGAVATAVGTLKVSGHDGDGRAFAQSSESVVVYCDGPDGWRIAIDAPWGMPKS
jgi:ketosteroid isomerase-like protein